VIAVSADISAEQVPSWRRFAQRTRSDLARRVLLERARATREPLGTAEVATLLASAPASSAEDVDLAVSLLGRPTDLTAFDDATRLALREAWTVVSHALVRLGRDDQVQEILRTVPMTPHHRWTLRTDLLNPSRTGAAVSDEAIQAWLTTLNEIFVADGLEPITAAAGGGVRSLSAEADEVIPGNELITVVMSAFRPGPELEASVRSIRNQSWQSWELLIVDDGSGPDHHASFAAVAGDPRVRVIHAPRNRGTYEARNLGLQHAQGRYVTFQDADDWSHPRRLERQVALFDGRPGLLANRSWAIRAHPDLTFGYPGYPARRLNASSLMIDRVGVLDLVGDFDRVRFSADLELPLRLQAARPGSVLDTAGPGHLAVTMLSPGSLSRDDAYPGWTRWSRMAYRHAFGEWHERVRAGRSPAHRRGAAARPFALPEGSWAPDRQHAVPPLTLAVMGDLRTSHPRARPALELARALRHHGPTALVHAESPRPLADGREAPHWSVYEALNQGVLRAAHPSQRVDVDVLLVTEPVALLHLSETDLRAATVLLIGDSVADDPVDVIRAIEQRARDLGATDPVWALTSAGSADRFRARRSAEAEVWSETLPWVVDPNRHSGVRVERRDDGHLVLGHHLADVPTSWALGRDELATLLPADPALDVRLLEGTSAVCAMLGRRTPPPGWIGLREARPTLAEFLGSLDAYLQLGTWDPTVEIAVLEALVAGLPVMVRAETLDAPGTPHDLRAHLHPVASAQDIASGSATTTAEAGLTAVRHRLDLWEVVLRNLREGNRRI